MRAGGGWADECRAHNARELQAVLEAERREEPFLVYRDPAGVLHVAPAAVAGRKLTVGRSGTADVCIGWDDQVSALHAELECVAGELTVLDDGLSRNGSYVNGERVHGRRRLRDGDRLRFGRTVVAVRGPRDCHRQETLAAGEAVRPAEPSERQRQVLVALCRPFGERDFGASPATNREIAEELHLSVDAVKLHLRALFEKFELTDLPQNRKRVELVVRALSSGLVEPRELTRGPS